MIAPHRRIVLFRVALVATVALTLHLATTDRPYPGVEQLNDKVSHILAFGALSLLADFSFPAVRFGPGKILALLGYGALIEVVQHFLPWREASFLDLLADSVGIAAYALGFPILDRIPVLRHLAALRRAP